MLNDSITTRHTDTAPQGTVGLARVRFAAVVVVPCGYVLSDPGGVR